jgi:hypothetical protein
MSHTYQRRSAHIVRVICKSDLPDRPARILDLEGRREGHPDAIGDNIGWGPEVPFMDQAFVTLLAALVAAVTAVFSTILGYVLNRKQRHVDDELNRGQDLLKSELESTRKATEQLRGAVLQSEVVLRKSRMDAYQRLWACLHRFPKEPSAPLPSAEDLSLARADLIAWYYEVGGLVMTRPTQRAYFALTALLAYLAEQDLTTGGWYGDLFVVASALRTHTTVDVYSRATSSLAPESDRTEADIKMRQVIERCGVEPAIGWEP